MPSQSFQLNIFSNFVESAPVLKKPDLFISHSMVERESKTCSGFTNKNFWGVTYEGGKIRRSILDQSLQMQPRYSGHTFYPKI